MTQLGTKEEIEAAYQTLNEAEWALCLAKLRLRALKGEGLMQTGDSFPSAAVIDTMAALTKEFGSRNLRVF